MSATRVFSKSLISQIKRKSSGRAKGKPATEVEAFYQSNKELRQLDWQDLTDRKADPKQEDGLEPIEEWKGRAAQALRNGKANLMKPFLENGATPNPEVVNKYKAIEILTVAEGTTDDETGEDIAGIYLYNPNGTPDNGNVEGSEVETAEVTA